MSHLRTISRRPLVAQSGEGVTSPLESFILLFLTIFFSGWTNGPTVIQNLADFYAKTPE
jgi:hypothetical protein